MPRPAPPGAAFACPRRGTRSAQAGAREDPARRRAFGRPRDRGAARGGSAAGSRARVRPRRCPGVRERERWRPPARGHAPRV